MLRIALLLVFLYGYSTIAPTAFAAPPAKSPAKPSTAKPAAVPNKKALENKAKAEVDAKKKEVEEKAKAEAEEKMREAEERARAEILDAAKNETSDVSKEQESSNFNNSEPKAEPPPVFQPTPPVSQPPPPIQPVSLDSIPKGFASQIQKNQPPPVVEPEPAPPVPEPTPVVPVSSSSSVSSSSVAPPPPPPPYKFYEDYLDSLVVFARNVLPGKQELETQKALINEERPGPKGEYEKQADYDYRIANFDKEKQKKIRDVEKKYEAEEKNRTQKLKDAINYKPDIQPEWAGILKQDAEIEGYHQRIARLSDKISFMKRRATDVMEILTNLELLSKGDLGTLDKKNRIYMARLERAIELMQDYIIQEQAKTKSTEKKQYDMVFGAYDPEKEQFQVNMNDIYSRTVPFDFVGFIKVSPQTAQEIDRKTDNFLGSVDYINYPFMVNGEAVYTGAKNANIYYKGNAVTSVGVFRNVGGFENLDGYIEWATYADSLISGKLASRKLDSSYAMKSVLPKIAPTGTWWSRNNNIVRGTLFALSATSLGIAIWQNSEVGSKTKNLQKDYDNAVKAQDYEDYKTYSKKYKDGVNDVRSSENMRNGFYIGAGLFGVAGVLSLCF
jgi:hypothetical protein